MEKQSFFRAALDGLGRYNTGGSDRIGVRRVKWIKEHNIPFNLTHYTLF